ncbi:hypothetical protein E6C50_04425 [Flavobacterium supellecticarium]|uniref:HNH endonuclease n=1 Tax=Flavobacterium supellecticarium TaxID=2565924 RepID=A0A4S4A4M4_9FLAO|nr:hypothetical protein [Flavobacterium supellecticarium]THF53454.1 hypothetical protein E6C50_04425 [Flavobacterium supellecticarium]
MEKKQSFGFSTPVRRTTKNISGNKVGGELTGSESEIIYTKKLSIDSAKEFEFLIPSSEAIGLFNKDIAIAAIGGYFISDKDVEINLSITINENTTKSSYILQGNRFEAIGNDFELDLAIKFNNAVAKIEFKVVEPTTIHYTHFAFGFISKEEFIVSEEAYYHYSNSKKRICFPEQFYFNENYEIDGSVNGDLIITKSCNRCQRYLPVNPFNQRQQLAFSNHCTTKAPCTHNGFSIYEVVLTSADKDTIEKKFEEEFDKAYAYKHEMIKCYFGHQLECKACKKFFVNAALNHLRSSSQHREDSLRRRAFELLCRKLLGLNSIYHDFRINTGKEFDKFIYEKFDKKCFNCNNPIAIINEMHLDHTMPLSHLYPLDETATCLCDSCNLAKSDIFPVDFYDEEKLKKLSEITEIPLAVISSRMPNEKALIKLKENVIWFIEDFLTHPEYQKDRDGKVAANSILHSVQKATNNSPNKYDILEEYGKAKKEGK